tara:strand:- start:653 stop:925 length:273 start_codon:yes stop_codon:yes gene_type:complete
LGQNKQIKPQGDNMFNNYLSEFLSKNRISQDQFSKSIGVSQAAVSRYLDANNPALPRADVWGKIAEEIAREEQIAIDVVLQRMYQSLREA